MDYRLHILSRSGVSRPADIEDMSDSDDTCEDVTIVPGLLDRNAQTGASAAVPPNVLLQTLLHRS